MKERQESPAQEVIRALPGAVLLLFYAVIAGAGLRLYITYDYLRCVVTRCARP